MNQATLSVAASAVWRIEQQHSEAAVLDAGFDGGEFSGPAHHRQAMQQVVDVLDDLGWSVREFEAALDARVSHRWLFHCSPFWGLVLEAEALGLVDDADMALALGDVR